MAIEVDVEADVAQVVRSSVTVKLQRDAAFRLFTERMRSWWPLATHSVFHAEAVAVTIEPVVGGRVYEATADGRTSDWGTVTEWQPGERLAMTWHPGEEPDLATLVEVTSAKRPMVARVSICSMPAGRCIAPRPRRGPPTISRDGRLCSRGSRRPPERARCVEAAGVTVVDSTDLLRVRFDQRRRRGQAAAIRPTRRSARAGGIGRA